MELERYEPRSIRFLEIHAQDGWRLKVYRIRHPRREADEALMGAAKGVALKHLPQPATSRHRYGVGFLSVHQGKSYDFVTVAWWAYESELYSLSFVRPSSVSYALEPLSGAELSHDVWDLYLMAFERGAWLEEVLKREGGPDLEGYLARQLTEVV
jgi:hypothetical protein